MNIKWIACSLCIMAICNSSLTYASQKNRNINTLKVYSVIANRPNLVPQKLCEQWFGKEITIRPALAEGEVPQMGGGVFYVNDKGVYSFKVNDRPTEIINTSFYYNTEQVAAKASQKTGDNLNTANTDVTWPASIVLQKPSRKYKKGSGYVSMRFCTALIEGH